MYHCHLSEPEHDGWCGADGAEVRGAAHHVRHHLVVVIITDVIRRLKVINTVMIITELVVIQEEGEVIEHQLLFSALPIAFKEVILTQILKTKKWLITIHSDNHLMQKCRTRTN